jgi:DNA-binding MarR family transcriptional regulator
MSDSVSTILNSLRVLVKALRVASRASEHAIGLTGAQLYVLEKLVEAGELTVNEVAEKTHTHQSTVSVVIRRLEEKGFVTRARSESDARVQKISISREGKAVLNRSLQTVQDRLVQAIKGLPAQQQAELARSLDAIITEAGLSNITPELFLEEPETKPTAKRS